MAKHILVIDDEEGICDSFALTFEHDKAYSVEIAATGEDGIEKARDKRPDIVFLDLNMPGIGGIETLRRLRSIYRDVPIYIVTAFHARYLQQLNAAEKEGIDFHLCHKPVYQDQIKKIVSSIFDKGKMERAKFFFRLYIAGDTNSSKKTIKSVKKIFEEDIGCEYELETIDILKEPQRAEADNIIATPTLMRINTGECCMIIGDLFDAERVLSGLGLLKGVKC